MKKVRFLLTFAATALFTLGMTGCSKDSGGKDSPGGEGSGQALNATVHVKITQGVGNPSLASKAPNDFHLAGNGEKELKTLRLYIFNKNTGLYEDQADFPIQGDPSTYTAQMTTTEGTKLIFAIANITGEWDTKLSAVNGNTTATQFMTIVQDLSNRTEFEKLTVPESMVMTNVVDKNYEFTLLADSDPASSTQNSVTVSIGRAVAKVSAFFDVATQNQPQSGVLSNVFYSIAGQPIKMNTMPYVGTSGFLETPLYDESWTASNYFNSYSYEAGVTPVDLTDQNEWKSAAIVSSNAPFFYVPENSSKAPVQQGRATRLVVAGTFTPAEVFDDQGASLGAGVTSETFYRLAILENSGADLVGYGEKFYKIAPDDDEIAAVYDLLTGNTGTPTVPGTLTSDDYAIVEYDKGICYYTTWIADNLAANQTDKYTVHRNFYYFMTITSVSGVGKSTPDGEEPWDPIIDPPGPIEGEEATLIATVEVLNWTPVESSTGI